MVLKVPKDNANTAKLTYGGETLKVTIKGGKMIFTDGNDKRKYKL